MISALATALRQAHDAKQDFAPSFIKLPNPLGRTLDARFQHVLKLFAHVAVQIGEDPVMSLREVAGGLDISRDYANVLLGQLTKRKILIRTERGFYKRRACSSTRV